MLRLQKIIILQIFCLCFFNLFGQIEEADRLFDSENYHEALQIYLNQYSDNIEDPVIKYKIGVCYFYSKNLKTEAIPFLKYAADYKNDQVPPEVFYYLARCYHYSYRVIPALDNFNFYLEEFESNPNLIPLFTDTRRYLEICSNLELALNSPINTVSVTTPNYPVNTSFNDFAPIIWNAGETMLFSSNRLQNSSKFIYEMSEEPKGKDDHIHMVARSGIGWSFLYSQKMSDKKVIPLSLSSNGEALLLFIGDDIDNGDIFISNWRKNKWTSPKKLDGEINSRFRERGACFSEGGNVIYFSSDRPGGEGGFDIYKCERKGRNNWSTPINLGSKVNTVYDEINPFMHPDAKTFYFSSDGHTTIGGLDIFQSILKEDDTWTTPQNLGVPINSTYNDDFFTQLPSTKYAYLSSDRLDEESRGQSDIISIYKPEKKLPLTIMRGIIEVWNKGETVPVNLKVWDTDTKTEQKYVYNPDVETGNYFVILNHNRNYTISISVENKEVHKVYINVPKETYSYELNSSIHIDDVYMLGKKIGAQVRVDSTSSLVTNLKEVKEKVAGQEHRYDALLILMEQIIERLDVEDLADLNSLEQPNRYTHEDYSTSNQNDSDYYKSLLDRINEAFEKSDPKLIPNANEPLQETDTRTIFYNENLDEENNRKILVSHQLPVSIRNKKAIIRKPHLDDLVSITNTVATNPNLKIELKGMTQFISEDIYSQYDNVSEFINEKVFKPARLEVTQYTYTDLEENINSDESLYIELIIFESLAN